MTAICTPIQHHRISLLFIVLIEVPKDFNLFFGDRRGFHAREYLFFGREYPFSLGVTHLNIYINFIFTYLFIYLVNYKKSKKIILFFIVFISIALLTEGSNRIEKSILIMSFSSLFLIACNFCGELRIEQRASSFFAEDFLEEESLSRIMQIKLTFQMGLNSGGIGLGISLKVNPFWGLVFRALFICNLEGISLTSLQLSPMRRFQLFLHVIGLSLTAKR